MIKEELRQNPLFVGGGKVLGYGFFAARTSAAFQLSATHGDDLIQFSRDSPSLFPGLGYLSQSATPFPLRSVFAAQRLWKTACKDLLKLKKRILPIPTPRPAIPLLTAYPAEMHAGVD